MSAQHAAEFADAVIGLSDQQARAEAGDGKNFRMKCTQLGRAQTTLASTPAPDEDDTDTEMAPVQCGFEFDRV